VTSDIDVNVEPLPGYRLIERIGAGGYGEVWRVEAPGGLTKAIKFVFGTQHEKRATNEMRALDHVRAVRHPFLLSLERIEIVGGRLLVVTELADGSVKDRFDLCRRDGMRGIPRAELLGYLRDAADALDFMSNTHSLQHLDIKPENLLLLAGHVKVADFGLVKDVRQSQASLVGGMTPLYAGPEVFRGCPSRHSDQYSLAIVYQEMLTGTLPFVGNSAAELTLHHLNDEPDLTSLTPADRYSVSRALSKDAEHRYASCREFVDSLISSGSGASYTETATLSASASQAPASFVDPTVRETEPADFFDDDRPADWSGGSQVLLEMPHSDCRLLDLPSVNLAESDRRPTPALILGIGGAAGQVLTQFRRMMCDRWGNSREIPAIQFLHIDTDPRALDAAERDQATAFAADEVLTVPLHRPQHYRDNSQQLLHWLSRRWLYNIPRSLRTEGLRPLGRLALADHARLVGQRIRRAVAQAFEPSNLSKSSSRMEQGFRSDAMRVFVVASISGGTGSGMSIDIGYAVRAILQKLNLKHVEVIGLMMHSTTRDARHSELARVNAFSWLSEFNHLQKKEHPYPGDASCGLPAHAAGVAAFDHTYIVQLGENLDTAEFEQATQSTAEYIYLNTLTPGASFFEECRSSATGDEGERRQTAQIRSFGVFRPGSPAADVCDGVAEAVSERVLLNWSHGESTEHGQKPAADDEQFVKRLHLDVAGITANSRALIEATLPIKPGDLLVEQTSTTGAFAAIDEIFQSEQSSGNAGGEERILNRPIAEIVAPLAEKLRDQVRWWVMRRVEEPAHRLAGARRSLETVREQVCRIQSELQRVRSAVANQLLQMKSNAAAKGKKAVSGSSGSNPGASLGHDYLQIVIDRATIAASDSVLQVISTECSAMSDELANLSHEIDQVSAALQRAASSRVGDDNISANDREGAVTPLEGKLNDLAKQVDAQLQAEFLQVNGGLVKTVMQGGRLRAQLNAKLLETARKIVQQTAAGVSCDAPGSGNNGLGSALALATPMLLEYGGNRRVLAVVPNRQSDGHTDAELSRALGTNATAVIGGDNCLTICVEASGLSLTHVALELVERRRDRVEFARRVHSRTDIAWTPLVSTETSNASIVWTTNESRATQDQHAMGKTLVM
jgi:serine/threonine protein kinase